MARVDSPAVSEVNWTDLEREFLAEHRWWDLKELEAATCLFGPRNLPALVPPILAGDYPSEPLAIEP